jgi:PKD repeat protein
MKKLLFGLLVILILIGVAACGGGQATYQGSDGNGYTTDTYHPLVTLTQPAPTTTTTVLATVPQTLSVGGEKSNVSYDTNAPAAIVDRMVIYNASLTIVADNITTALQQITDLAKNNGGFVVNSNVGEDQNRLYAYISFRVLSERFNDTVEALHHIALDVKAESTTGQDVTEEYTDLSSKLRNLEASEAQLLELMKKAGSVEEILAVQKELVSTREQIELNKGRMQYLEQSSHLALFNVNLEQSKLIVEFTAETRTVKAGVAIPFNPNVTGGFSPYSFEWNFGDGGTSTEVNPLYAYNSDGTYTVTLKVTDDKGSTAESTRENYIKVLAGWSAGSVVDSAWSGLVNFGHGLLALFIGLGIFSPVWIVILVILYFAWWRRRKQRKAK